MKEYVLIFLDTVKVLVKISELVTNIGLTALSMAASPLGLPKI